MCLSNNCMFCTRPTVCFHQQCYQFRVYKVTPSFLAATQYAFTPSTNEQRHRTRYIQQALARKLSSVATWPRNLPRELWSMIASHLLPECATLTSQELVHESDNISNYTLDLTQPVYASYINIDGRYYIKSLRNSAGAKSGNGTCLVLPAQTSLKEGRQANNQREMFIAGDHLGIRQVVFISPDLCAQWCRAHPVVPGVWWKHISREAIPSAVAMISDVCKSFSSVVLV